MFASGPTDVGLCRSSLDAYLTPHTHNMADGLRWVLLFLSRCHSKWALPCALHSVKLRGSIWSICQFGGLILQPFLSINRLFFSPDTIIHIFVYIFLNSLNQSKCRQMSQGTQETPENEYFEFCPLGFTLCSPLLGLYLNSLSIYSCNY